MNVVYNLMLLDSFLNLHKSPITFIYISLLLSFLLSLPGAKTPYMMFRNCEKFKTWDWEDKCLKYKDWNMC